VHNGKDYVLVVATQDMVGHKLAELSGVLSFFFVIVCIYRYDELFTELQKPSDADPVHPVFRQSFKCILQISN
jgi:hypothetical protein